jgi:hypothetical protein
MDRKRRRHDSDDDDDDNDHVRPTHSLTSSSGLFGLHPAASLEDLVVDNDMLRHLGMDDIISSDDDEALPEVNHGDATHQYTAAADRASPSMTTTQTVAPCPAEAHNQGVLLRRGAANINIRGHTRRQPRGEISGSRTINPNDDLLFYLHAIDHAVLQRQRELSAEQIMSLYRCDAETRSRKLAVGTSSVGSVMEGNNPMDQLQASDGTSSSWRNRYGMVPGWRWDGVCRGTGAEEAIFGS